MNSGIVTESEKRSRRPVIGFEVDDELNQRIREERWKQRKSLSELCREYVVQGLIRDMETVR